MRKGGLEPPRFYPPDPKFHWNEMSAETIALWELCKYFYGNIRTCPVLTDCKFTGATKTLPAVGNAGHKNPQSLPSWCLASASNKHAQVAPTSVRLTLTITLPRRLTSM